MTAARDHIKKHGKPDDAIVQEIVRRVVEVADPDRIILFGSGARGDMGPHSDLDFLVIKSGEYSRHRLVGEMYSAICGVGLAADFILATPETVERHKHEKFLIFYPATTEGVEVYSDGLARRSSAFASSTTSENGDSHRMQQHDDDPHDHQQEWMNFARSDLAFARLHNIEGLSFEGLCFHAQQATEKALKAVMIHREMDFPYTHQIKTLISLLSDGGVEVGLDADRADELTRYAVLSRYAGLPEPVTREEYESALEIAEQIVEWAEDQIQRRDQLPN